MPEIVKINRYQIYQWTEHMKRNDARWKVSYTSIWEMAYAKRRCVCVCEKMQVLYGLLIYAVKRPHCNLITNYYFHLNGFQSNAMVNLMPAEMENLRSDVMRRDAMKNKKWNGKNIHTLTMYNIQWTLLLNKHLILCSKFWQTRLAARSKYQQISCISAVTLLRANNRWCL